MWILVQNFHFPTCFCSSTGDMKLSKLDLPASKLQEWSVRKGAESAAYITVHAPISSIKTHRELPAAKLSEHSSYFAGILLKWNKVKKNPSNYRTPLWIFSLPIWSCGELSSCLRSLWAAWGQASTRSADGSELCWGTKARFFPHLGMRKACFLPCQVKEPVIRSASFDAHRKMSLIHLSTLFSGNQEERNHELVERRAHETNTHFLMFFSSLLLHQTTFPVQIQGFFLATGDRSLILLEQKGLGTCCTVNWEGWFVSSEASTLYFLWM